MKERADAEPEHRDLVVPDVARERTGVIRDALARLNASIMINSSIRLWLLGGPVDCTTNTSSPRTFSSILTKVSPSGNALTAHLPNSMPM